MNWYKNIVLAASMEETLQQWGVSQDVAWYISTLKDNNLRGKLMNQIRQNPQMSLQEVQGWQPEQKQQVDPYMDWEYDLIDSRQMPEHAEQWALVNLRKSRKGQAPQQSPDASPNFILDANFEEYTRQWHTLSRLIRTNELDDLLRFNPSYDINSHTIDQVSDDAEEWHDVMQGNGEGRMYSPTNQELIVYGPKWSNPEWGGWTIQEVRSENDLAAEGNKAGHCVGGYCQDVDSGRVRIFSLRDPKNEPHVTMESDGYNWDFKQIYGNGPKTGNVDPGDNYKIMIREWFRTLDNPTYGGEENETLDNLSDGNYNSRETPTSEMARKALDWYNEENEYGIVTNKNGEKPSFENIYDAAISGASKLSSGRDIHPHSVSGVGEEMVDWALKQDISRIESGELSEQSMVDLAGKSLASKERYNQFYTLKKNEKGKSWWDQSTEQKKAYIDYLLPYMNEDDKKYALNYSFPPEPIRPSHAEKAHDISRGNAIIQEASQNPETRKQLYQQSIKEFEKNSYFEQVMYLREEKEQEFSENMMNYYKLDIPYPNEEDYEDEEDYNDAMKEYEEKESSHYDYARQESVEGYFSEEVYKSAVKQFENYDIQVPEWLLIAASENFGNPSWVWIFKQAKPKENRVASNNWYVKIKKS